MPKQFIYNIRQAKLIPTKPRLENANFKFCHELIPKAAKMKRNTHEKTTRRQRRFERNVGQTSLGGEVWAGYVITHKIHSSLNRQKLHFLVSSLTIISQMGFNIVLCDYKAVLVLWIQIEAKIILVSSGFYNCVLFPSERNGKFTSFFKAQVLFFIKISEHCSGLRVYV